MRALDAPMSPFSVDWLRRISISMIDGSRRFFAREEFQRAAPRPIV
jgi:hypothetical protein